MKIPKIDWLQLPLDTETVSMVEPVIRDYFAQDSTISAVTLRALIPGRSGALPFTADLIGARAGGAVALQPEFVKLAKSKNEVRSFEEFASGTALVFGQHLARAPYTDPRTGLTAFGFKLFENGADVLPFFAIAQESPMRACRLLNSFCASLQDWYGSLTEIGSVPLGVSNSRIEELLANLDILSSGTAKLVALALDRLRSTDQTGSLTRIHGDLHLENLLVPRNADFCYVIDFANSSSTGSPCMDIARLESDIIYRTLPYDMSPDDIGRFESHLWNGHYDDLSQISAGALVMTLRRSLKAVASPNAAIWLLTGRILNGLKMIANTWLSVRPFGFEERKRGIVASLRVLANALGDAIDGRIIKLSNGETECKLPSEGLRSIRWMYSNRFYDDAFELSTLLSKANANCRPEQSIIGSLSALSGSVPGTTGAALFSTATPRVRTTLARGLKALYQAVLLTKGTGNRELKKAARLFGTARQFLEASEDSFFTSVALDQMARCQQESGEPDAAKITFRDAIRLKEHSNDTVGLATSVGGLGLLELASGFYGESRGLFERDLELVEKTGDRRAEIKIYNWLGQVALLESYDVVKSVYYMTKSIELANRLAIEQSSKPLMQRYSSELDLTFGYIGLGFAFVFSENPERAAECAERADQALGNVGGISAYFASSLLELQTAMILWTKGQERRAMIRTRGALSYLKELSLLDYCDYSVRTIRFYANRNQFDIATKLARETMGPLRTLKLAKLHEIVIANEVTK